MCSMHTQRLEPSPNGHLARSVRLSQCHQRLGDSVNIVAGAQVAQVGRNAVATQEPTCHAHGRGVRAPLCRVNVLSG